MSKPSNRPAADPPRRFDPPAALEAERLDLCRLLDTLDEGQWSTPSLCDGWTVHDVVAHLSTSTRTGLREMVVAIVRARFDFDRAEADTARTIARTTDPDTLVKMLRDHADSTRHAPGSSTPDQLLDVIVHAQDIARPLDLDHPVHPARAIPALDHALASRWYGAEKRFDDVQLAATDTAWASGDGERRLEAPLADLLLLATGRVAGLDNATGDGATIVAERLGATRE
ncbi:maleylpyruvate isomerase family mycothiol-dependent enzyme [Ilumatobacter nonamiensis]|uniref:maleylpyruvate isomerase family mycothiol-dependent enzyme n=1 Tax=Ilumatobacter nonamiensis TaxID=467093 RepID=UPI0003475C27|nr:maleylpyruvate isomerase family mycothiol-dependent enzyme [Ilumatobacter nonamiensis]